MTKEKKEREEKDHIDRRRSDHESHSLVTSEHSKGKDSASERDKIHDFSVLLNVMQAIPFHSWVSP